MRSERHRLWFQQTQISSIDDLHKFLIHQEEYFRIFNSFYSLSKICMNTALKVRNFDI